MATFSTSHTCNMQRISDFFTSVIQRHLNFPTIVIHGKLKFLQMTIFFSTNDISGISDKYEVCSHLDSIFTKDNYTISFHCCINSLQEAPQNRLFIMLRQIYLIGCIWCSPQSATIHNQILLTTFSFRPSLLKSNFNFSSHLYALWFPPTFLCAGSSKSTQ